MQRFVTSPATPAETRSTAERNRRILIVDDNPSIHQDIRKILCAGATNTEEIDEVAAELFGTEIEAAPNGDEFSITSAYQGQEALRLLEKAVACNAPYALAFVDIRMPPGWDGVETISRLWSVAPDLQVVICTAYSDYSWEEMIRKLGKTDSLVILKKPFDNIEVLQLAHTLTEKWSLSAQLRTHLANLDRAVENRTAELQAANTRLRQEIAEREEAQRELDRSEERFAKAFQASPIPMAIQSLTTQRYLDVNQAFVHVTGFARAEIVGRTSLEAHLMCDFGAEEELALRLQRDHSVREFPCQFRTREGHDRDCSLFAETIMLGADHVALVALLDVSEQRKLEKLLRQSQKLEAVGQLAAGVAHDFNNILTIIQGHATMQLAVGHFEKDVASSFDQISAAAERAAGLTRQLLAFSRKQIVLPRTLCLNDIVDNLREMLRRLIGEHIDLQVQLCDGLPDIYADESNMEQIVVNLVVNARDAMAHGGRLTLQTEIVEFADGSSRSHPDSRPGRFTRLRVSDTGCGMSTEVLSHIFEPFFTTKEVGKGTGLGLATVYGIVAQHEGWIEVQSQLGHGTTFSVYLPLSEVAAEIAIDRSAEPLGLRGGDETILLVEDEPDVREIVSGILETNGYRVFSAADGPEALDLWSRTPGIDLLVTDMVMPNGLKGNDLAERLRAEKPSLKVIYSSGYSREVAGDLDELGEDSFFLEKPYKLDGLLRAVRDCLDGSLCNATAA